MPPQPTGPWSATRYQFTSGVRAGEIATIRNGDGAEILSYRSFASVVPVVGALMAGIVLVTGLGAAMFLFAEKRFGAAFAVVALSCGFSAVIAALIPPVRVTLYEGTTQSLTIAQRRRIPFTGMRYLVRTADGTTLALLRKGVLSRLGRNRWTIDGPPEARGVAWAVEESLPRALVRKVAGKFQRRFETNIRISHHDAPVGTIIRRPEGNGEFDLLEISPASTLDRRVTVALATLVFGSEP